MGASFAFTRNDGVQLRLAHEPLFRKPRGGFNRIYSWTSAQQPDIVLEATFPSGEQLIWIFDAKYRIANTTSESSIDLAPDDAINQMHRYRDALIHLGEPVNGIPQKSRPVVGAYALFPGWYPDQSSAPENPYWDAIESVGIGAFPALPGQTNEWLATFLKDNLGSPPASAEYQVIAPDEHLARDSVRIAPVGLKLRRSTDLVLIARTGPGRLPEYLDGFRNGTARWYHIPAITLTEKQISATVIADITSCAIAVPNEQGSSEIGYLFEIKSAELVQRSVITTLQAGKSMSKPEGAYWLFSLGRASPLDQPIRFEGGRKFSFKISDVADLNGHTQCKDIPDRYDFLYRTGLSLRD